MFENLSNREKKLLLAIGALVPIMIIFFGFITMRSKLKVNNDQLASLKSLIAEQKELEIEGMLADRRQAFYANASLPPSINIASNKYQRWLKPTMTESGVTWDSMNPKAGLKLRSGNETIGQSLMFSVNATGTLSAFNDFLGKFYQMDMLHRITKITVTPDTEGRTTTRNGDLKLKMDFEILSLKTGKNRGDLEEFPKHLANSEKDYADILRRNIFGPANSEPIINAPDKSTTAGNGKPYGFSITAKDANKNDLLTFELLESDVPDAFLKPPTRETSRSVRFEMPDIEPGEYDFQVKVSDNGFPAKSSIKEFTVTVKAKTKPKEKKVVEKKKDPELDYIQLVKVTGIVKDRDGQLRVWLSGPTGQLPELAVGETFELGKKKYEVVSIDRDEATFAGDEKTFVGRPDLTQGGKLIETEL